MTEREEARQAREKANLEYCLRFCAEQDAREWDRVTAEVARFRLQKERAERYRAENARRRREEELTRSWADYHDYCWGLH